ncbi:hypothetical protein DFH06DRAFT_223501 [Mycena polygramma]|nr:hypothetical protein DFH06DRAFT_223501 [Mycena polygramma]
MLARLLELLFVSYHGSGWWRLWNVGTWRLFPCSPHISDRHGLKLDHYVLHMAIVLIGRCWGPVAWVSFCSVYLASTICDSPFERIHHDHSAFLSKSRRTEGPNSALHFFFERIKHLGVLSAVIAIDALALAAAFLDVETRGKRGQTLNSKSAGLSQATLLRWNAPLQRGGFHISPKGRNKPLFTLVRMFEWPGMI